MTDQNLSRQAGIAQSQPAEAFASHLQDAEWFDAIPGERLSIRLHNTRTGGKYSIMESYAAPGSAAPLHTHQEDELFLVLTGKPTFMLGKEIIEAQAGAIIVIPGGTPHCWKNGTSEETHMLAIFLPGGVEDLFTKIAGLSPERIAGIAAEYGTKILGPPME